MSTTALLVVAWISALLVLRDARRHDVPAPFLWGSAVLVFWIAALPIYILCRLRVLPRSPNS